MKQLNPRYQIQTQHPKNEVIKEAIRGDEVVSRENLPRNNPIVPTIVTNIPMFPQIDKSITSHQYYHKTFDQYDDKNDIYAVPFGDMTFSSTDPQNLWICLNKLFVPPTSAMKWLCPKCREVTSKTCPEFLWHLYIFSGGYYKESHDNLQNISNATTNKWMPFETYTH